MQSTLIDLREIMEDLHILDFNYEVMSEDLYDYMENHNIVKSNILKYSLGGKVAMKWCFLPNNKEKVKLWMLIFLQDYITDLMKIYLKILYRLPLEDFNKREEIDNKAF